MRFDFFAALWADKNLIHQSPFLNCNKPASKNHSWLFHFQQTTACFAFPVSLSIQASRF